LGGHHNNVVSQYSIWAITENKSLGLEDLGIDIRNIEQQPPNVRAWLFRLIAMTPEDAEQNFEFIELGTQDPAVEARAGLALGLRDTYFDGIEALVLDWFTSESDTEVSQHLLDHMVRQCSNCANYEAMVLEVYEKEPTGSSLRQRMEAAAAGSSLYGKFKRMDGSLDLFRGATSVTNNTFNVSGNIQGGAVSLGGDATNFAPTTIHYSPQTIEAIQSELSMLESELHQANINARLRREIVEHVQAARADPGPEKISKVIMVVRQAGEAVLAGTAIWEIGHVIAKLAGFG